MTGESGFIADFCGASDVTTHFSNGLGKYTPCFVDTVVLGKSFVDLPLGKGFLNRSVSFDGIGVYGSSLAKNKDTARSSVQT